MSVYFIRHGESQANSEGVFAGQTDAMLTPLGVLQAREAGENLRSSGLKVDVIISSPLSRAYNTALEIAKAIDYPTDKIVLDSLLQERNLGSLEGRPAKDSLRRMIAMSEDELVREGVETVSAITKRAQEMLNKLQKIEGNVLLVSHNGLGRGLFALTHSVAFYSIQKLPNAQVLDLASIPPLENK
jgi:broad specificity phosphatase PhoE